MFRAEISWNTNVYACTLYIFPSNLTLIIPKLFWNILEILRSFFFFFCSRIRGNLDYSPVSNSPSSPLYVGCLTVLRVDIPSMLVLLLFFLLIKVPNFLEKFFSRVVKEKNCHAKGKSTLPSGENFSKMWLNYETDLKKKKKGKQERGGEPGYRQ